MDIVKITSPNFTNGRKTFQPEAIVIHIMEGNLQGTASWFRSPQSKVSSHYGIGLNGQIHQYVEEKDTAWHAGRVNAPSWRLIKMTPNGVYVNPNLYTIGIEHEGNENSDWTDEMYKASSTLIREICNRWNIPFTRNHIIGHHEIYSLKTCPGNKVDIAKLISLAQNNGNHTSPSSVNKVSLTGKGTTTTRLNIRLSPDSLKAPLAQVPPGVQLAYDGYTDNGEDVQGNSKWYYTDEGNWFWSGGVK